MRILGLLFVVSMLAMPSQAGDGRRVRIGGIGVGYSHITGGSGGWGPWGYYPGSAFYPGWPGGWGAMHPFWYYPYVHPGVYGGFGYAPNLGQVKLSGADRNASVYIDGAFAGVASKLKNMWLEPGSYELEVREADGRSYQRKIYVLTGKRLEVKPELAARTSADVEEKK